jgi:hypothetical protein
MSRARVLPLVALLAGGTLIGGCDIDGDQDPGPRPDIRLRLMRAAQSTLGAGPSRVTATVGADAIRYRVRGSLDPEGGYRLCGLVVKAAPAEFLLGHSLWLEGRAGSYGTLTTLSASRRCRRAATWLDDHPPTLDLRAGPRVGREGEDLLHATLIALTALPSAPVSDARASECGDSECVQAVVDFATLDQKPAQRDEDGWTLRPLLRSLGRHPITVRIDRDGYLSRIELAGARVTLSDYGEANHVPRVVARAIE